MYNTIRFCIQSSFDDFTESAAMLLFALKRRRLYLHESSQEFNNTAALMLDGVEPPSATFCSSQYSGSTKLSIAGDPIGMCPNIMVTTVDLVLSKVTGVCNNQYSR